MANTANIQILRSYSNTAPSYLLDGQLAYSFVSNTLFIGSNTSVITIGDPSTAVIARSAQSNTIFTQGVDATQNPQATAINYGNINKLRNLSDVGVTNLIDGDVIVYQASSDQFVLENIGSVGLSIDNGFF